MSFYHFTVSFRVSRVIRVRVSVRIRVRFNFIYRVGVRFPVESVEFCVGNRMCTHSHNLLLLRFYIYSIALVLHFPFTVC